MEKRITHASLFSGIGAPELAAVWMGWQNLFHCEINEFCLQVLNYWYPESKSYEDITTTDFSEWRGCVDVLTGGFPCQPFSSAGQRRGADDDRYLWPEMLRVIRQVRPTYVIGENVAGILSMVQPGSETKVERQATLFDAGDTHSELRQQYVVETVCQDLEAEGYSVQPFVIPACAVGAPHRRDRVWFIAKRRVPAPADDSHDTRVQRGSRVHEGATGAEGLQERHKAQQPPFSGDILQPPSYSSNAGPEGMRGNEDEVHAAGLAAHTAGRRGAAPSTDRDAEGQGWTDDGKPCKRRTETEWNHGLPELPRTATDTQCRGGYEMGSDLQSQQSDGAQPVGDGCQRNVAGTVADNTRSIRRDAQHDDNGASQSPQEAACGAQQPLRADCPQSWWWQFPTVSPVCNGNDGLPFDISRIAVPYPKHWRGGKPNHFARWRAESIKALGNSMVPQVVMELFKAIEEDMNTDLQRQ